MVFECNRLTNTTEITHVSEPTTCKYEIEMKTPLACENEDLVYSMRVYGHLNDELKLKWNHIYSEFKMGVITQKVSVPYTISAFDFLHKININF